MTVAITYGIRRRTPPLFIGILALFSIHFWSADVLSLVRMDVLSGKRFVKTALDILSGGRSVRTHT